MSVTIPILGAQVPRRGNAISLALSVLAFRLSGWRIAGNFPDLPKFVVIVAPHTSNWDFFLGLMAMFGLGLRGRFLGKHTIFRWPFGYFMRWLGGLPVIRTSSHNVVQQTVQHFADAERMVLALSPEGTRKKLPAWRTGFYWVAQGAQVPIVPVSFDYPARCITIHGAVMPTGQVDADLRLLQAHFHPAMARYPAQY